MTEMNGNKFVPSFKAPDATEPEYKAVDFIETYTGRPFFPLDPDPHALSIIDIAHALANQCRYAGSTNYFYSVNQHSCLLATYAMNVRKASALDCLQVLMHDAPETYLPDMPRPVKQHMPEYRVWEGNIDRTIRHWLGLDNIPVPDFLSELDSRVIIDERAQLKSNSGLDWGHVYEPLGIKIEPWTPMYAEQQFLLQFAAYSNAVYGVHNYLRNGWGVPMRAEYTDFDDGNPKLVDLIEVDIRGGVGRVKSDSPVGWEWLHGKFVMTDARVQ